MQLCTENRARDTCSYCSNLWALYTVGKQKNCRWDLNMWQTYWIGPSISEKKKKNEKSMNNDTCQKSLE